MELLQAIRSRKSVRSFSDKTVSRELVEKIIEVATHAPTNCNQQLWNFVVVEDSATKDRLVKEAASSTLLRRAPVMVVVTYDGWNYKEALQGASLAVGHMLLAATEFGLGSLPMNSYGADSQVKKILNIPENQTICCFVLLGFSDERAQAAPMVPRRDFKETVHWGTFAVTRPIPFLYNPESWTKEDLINHQRFYCRKTVMGKEMDIMSDFERQLVRRELQTLTGSVHDILSYDGAYLKEFPKTAAITTYDLCVETAAYTEAAAAQQKITLTSAVLGAESSGKHNISTSSTVLFKLERIPSSVRREVYDSATGELIIISRKQNLFLSAFFFAIKIVFGSDMRRTGIYTFFGPYLPLSLSRTLKELRGAGFKNIQHSSYFALPAFFEQVYQMFLQYRASEGSSYLHRERRTDSISRLIAFVLRVQGLRRMGWFGSVVVIRARK